MNFKILFRYFPSKWKFHWVSLCVVWFCGRRSGFSHHTFPSFWEILLSEFSDFRTHYVTHFEPKYWRTLNTNLCSWIPCLEDNNTHWKIIPQVNFSILILNPELIWTSQLFCLFFSSEILKLFLRWNRMYVLQQSLNLDFWKWWSYHFTKAYFFQISE